VKKPEVKLRDKISAFFCKMKQIKIKKGGLGKVSFEYMPMQLKEHRCSFIFQHENVGEMEYLVIGETLPPEHYEAPAYRSTLELAKTYSFNIMSVNTNRLEAENKHKERLRIQGKVEERS